MVRVRFLPCEVPNATSLQKHHKRARIHDVIVKTSRYVMTRGYPQHAHAYFCLSAHAIVKTQRTLEPSSGRVLKYTVRVRFRRRTLRADGYELLTVCSPQKTNTPKVCFTITHTHTHTHIHTRIVCFRDEVRLHKRSFSLNIPGVIVDHMTISLTSLQVAMDTESPLFERDAGYYEFTPGKWLPGNPMSNGNRSFNKDVVAKAVAVEFEDSDVLIATYPKTGQWKFQFCHWT